MRVVIQRAANASCSVDGILISKIEKGLLLLVGLTDTDTSKEVEYCAKKIADMRIFEDEDGKLNESILDKGYEILSISQFTLYAETKKGNRPSFTKAMEPNKANELYKLLTYTLENEYGIKTYNGKFGEMMDINFTNEGPVTIILESK